MVRTCCLSPTTNIRAEKNSFWAEHTRTHTHTFVNTLTISQRENCNLKTNSSVVWVLKLPLVLPLWLFSTTASHNKQRVTVRVFVFLECSVCENSDSSNIPRSPPTTHPDPTTLHLTPLQAKSGTLIPNMSAETGRNEKWLKLSWIRSLESHHPPHAEVARINEKWRVLNWTSCERMLIYVQEKSRFRLLSVQKTSR